MSRRVVHLSGVVLLLAAAPAWAGQSVTSQPESPAKAQTFAYENALKSAVFLGGQKLAQQASMLVPQIELATSEQPIVRGIKLDGWGFFFDVQAPDIQSTMMVWDMVNQSRRNRPPVTGPTPEGPARPVADRVVGTGVAVDPDPMANDLAAPGGADRAYSSFVREALIDAMLDSSGVLQLGANDHLTVAASGVDQPGSNPLYRPRKLKLTIKGSDLLELRQGRITREQAKDRIVEERF